MDRQYRAFISYRHTEWDAAIAKKVHTAIEEYIIPRSLRQDGERKFGLVFRDEEELPISGNLSESIRQALDASRHLIVICSPEARESMWVPREISYFLQHHDPSQVYTVLTAGEPDTAFPPEVTHVPDRKNGGFMDVEPLAVDVRASTRAQSFRLLKKRLPKLYAAMLGCPYDTLVQREKKRRARRRAAISSLVLAVVLAFLVMVMVKNRELTQMNAELQQSNEALLLRESSLLTAEAEECLAAGDRLNAISLAISALPAPDAPRPYYAPAERTLFSCLDLFRTRTNTSYLLDTVITQASPIEDLFLSQDSRYAVTIDAYGNVMGYLAADGAPLWRCAVTPGRGVTYCEETGLFPGPDGDTVIALYDAAFAAIRLSDGHCLWQTPLADAIRTRAHLSEDGRELLFVTSSVSGPMDKLMTSYALCRLDTLSGTLHPGIPLFGKSFSLFENVGFPSVNSLHRTDLCMHGSRVLLSCIVPEGDAAFLGIYEIDLATGSSALRYREPVQSLYSPNEVLAIAAAGETSFLLVRTQSQDAPYGFRADLFSLQTGEMIWSAPVTAANRPISSNSRCFLRHSDDSFLLFIDDQAVHLDRSTGQIRHRIDLPSPIAAMYDDSQWTWGFLLESGQYAVGWLSADGSIRHTLLDAVPPLAPMRRAAVSGGGFYKAGIEEMSIKAVVLLSPAHHGGLTAVLPQEDPCSAIISRVFDLPSPQTTLLDTGLEQGYFQGHYRGSADEDAVLVGPISRSKPEEGQTKDHFVLIDTRTAAIRQVIPVQEPASRDIFILPGQAGCIASDSARSDVFHIAEDGTVTRLSAYEEVILSQTGNVTRIANRNTVASVRLDGSQDVITARCNGDTLALWRNGQPLMEVPLPEDIIWQVHDQAVQYNLLKPLPNGHILMSDFARADGRALAHFLLFDPAEQTWTRIEDAAHGNETRLVTLDAQRNALAVMDDDRLLRIYSLKTGALMDTFPLELSPNAIRTFGFVPAAGEHCVWFFTNDGQIRIHRPDGTLLFQHAFTSALSSQDDAVHLIPDPAQQRLYISSASQCVCIDQRSGEPLFTLNNYLCFLPDAGVVLTQAPGAACQFQVMPVPSTEALTDMARQAIAP